MTRPLSRRAGGREARKALRAAPLADDIRPIRAGMKGGLYRPLSDAGVARIHSAALDALETIGLADAPPSGVELLTKAGAILGDDGRIRFPRSLVEDMLAVAGRDITLHGRDPVYDMHLSGSKVHYGTAGAAVFVADPVTNTYRESTVQDLFEAAKIAQSLDNIHFFQRPMVCRDIPDNRELDLNTIYASCSGTLKHVGTSIFEPQFVPEAFEMLHMIAGDEATWRARPFVSASICFVIPPLKFATDACLVMERFIRGGMPVLLLSAGQAGATSPAPIAGAVTQAIAECLAGLVYVNAIKPGHPAVFGPWPFVSDLRTGAMSGGSGEQALMTAACAQMGQFYDLPTGAPAGFADSKMPDMQAGWEQATSAVMAGLSGLNMVYESAGMHASLLGFCPESLILSDDIVGQAIRCVRGIEVNEDTVGLEVIRSVCLDGPGHFLGHEQTLGLMQSEYVYPSLGDRRSPKEWEEVGKPDLILGARAKKEHILAGDSPAAFDPALDARLRAAFPIRLK